MEKYLMFKQFGAIYLILGTCVAAGMLGLPVVSASSHYMLTVFMLTLAWALMSLGAWALLKVNLLMPEGANLISMADYTLGPIFKYITWVVILMLEYTLICAYLAASGDLTHALFSKAHFALNRSVATVVATLVLGLIVYAGMSSVDWVNRFLMTTKIIICFIVIAAILPNIHLNYLQTGNMSWHGSAFLVMITSFGYSIILPSIRVYLQSDSRALYRVLIIGGVLPLILYLFWIAAVQGVVPRSGAHGLLAMNGVANTTSMLMIELARISHTAILGTLSVIFVSICSVTGFLGVSLSLMDALADGFKQTKKGWGHLGVALLTYLPPMFIVLFAPSLFIHALAYAGSCCIFVLIILPIMMLVATKIKK
jgi:tyrosine-specific transport protein